ncbi:MAG: ATP-binding protein, partial [Sphingobium sp.]
MAEHGRSDLERAALLTEEETRLLLAAIGREGMEGLLTRWELRARPEQLPPPGDWTIWLVMAGRGLGKTRAGAEWV